MTTDTDAFRAAWHAADARGEKGHRVRAGLDAAYAVRDTDRTARFISLQHAVELGTATAQITGSPVPGDVIAADAARFEQYLTGPATAIIEQAGEIVADAPENIAAEWLRKVVTDPDVGILGELAARLHREWSASRDVPRDVRARRSVQAVLDELRARSYDSPHLNRPAVYTGTVADLKAGSPGINISDAEGVDSDGNVFIGGQRMTAEQYHAARIPLSEITERLHRQRDEARRERDAFDEDLRELRDLLGKAESSITALRQVKREQRDHIERLHGDVTALRAQLADRNARVEQYTATVAERGVELDSLRETVARKQRVIEGQGREIANLKAERADLTLSVQQLREQSAQRLQIIGTVTAERDARTRELDRFTLKADDPADAYQRALDWGAGPAPETFPKGIHFAPYGTRVTGDGVHIPTPTKWDENTGDYAEGAKFTTKRERVTCTRCRTLIGLSAGESDVREAWGPIV